MSRPSPRRAEGNAGAFLGPDVMIPVPMRPLPAEGHDGPTGPIESDREPTPEAPGFIRRLLARLSPQPDHRSPS
jgi:hypothetical protein